MNIKNKIKNLGLFDFLMIGFLILIIVFFAVFFSRKTKYLEVTIKITENSILYAKNNPQAWFVYLFKPGMKEKNGLGQTSAEVEKVYFYDVSEAKKAAYIDLKLKTNYNRQSQNYSYKGKALLVGSPIKIELQDVLIEGLVTAVEGLPDPRKEVELIVKSQILENNLVFPETNGIPIFLADAVKVGDKFYNSENKAVVTVLEKNEELAKKIVTNDKGEVFLRRDPLKKDVYLTLKLLAKQTNNEYFLFDDLQIKIGNGIPILTESYSVWPVITEFVKTP